MYRRSILESLALAIGLLFTFGVFSCFAESPQESLDEISITTYYPSPYGSYNQLSTNKFAVGDTNADGNLTDADQPNRDGDIRIKPQTGDPASWVAGGEGQVAYSATNDTLYVNNGSAWVAQGAETAVMYLSCAWGTDYTAGDGRGWDGSCTPPSCPSGWTSSATFSEPLSVACPGSSGCYWASTSPDLPPGGGWSLGACLREITFLVI